MSILATILAIAKVTGGISLSRTVGSAVSKFGERFFPYQNSKAYKQVEHNAAKQEELERMREVFQAKYLDKTLRANKEIAVFNQVFSRQTSMLLAEYNTHFNLRHSLIQDAIRNFPLNVSPLVLLENNNINTNFLLGNNSDNNDDEQILETMFESLGKTKPLSVFITPIHIDSRVNGKELIAAQVFDNVYSDVESVFVNEYSRNGERPVIFYPTAWNKNVKGGLHAAEELYYFLKDLPTLVVEPRFDEKKLNIMFSCWGLGYSDRTHFRQEMPLNLDWNSLLAASVYERSKQALKTYNGLDDKFINEQKNMYQHNVDLFEKLNLEKRLAKRFEEIQQKGSSTELDELGDYTKLFYATSTDVQVISEMVSAAIGMMLAAISDTHHLLASDVEPQLPHIYQKYFPNYVDKQLLNNFLYMYEQTYYKLEQEFPEQKDKREIELLSVKKLLTIGDDSGTNSPTSEINILRNKCMKLGASKTKVDNWNKDTCLDFYIENMQTEDREFYSYLFQMIDLKWKVKLQTKLQQLKYNK